MASDSRVSLLNRLRDVHLGGVTVTPGLDDLGTTLNWTLNFFFHLYLNINLTNIVFLES